MVDASSMKKMPIRYETELKEDSIRNSNRKDQLIIHDTCLLVLEMPASNMVQQAEIPDTDYGKQFME